MSKRSARTSPEYANRLAARKRLRAVIGWGVRLRDLPAEQRQDAERRATEPLIRASLHALAAGLPVTPKGTPSTQAPVLALIFEARFRDALLRGEKQSTIRKRSSHTARYKIGARVRVEAPKGQVIGETIIIAVDDASRIAPSEREALRRIYGKAAGPMVRLSFERVTAND